MHRNNRQHQQNGASPARHPRKIKPRDRRVFYHEPREKACLSEPAGDLLRVPKQNHDLIQERLSKECDTIEHQIIALRSMIQLSQKDYDQRYLFTELLLACIYQHHRVLCEGVLFGSTVNGLGFHDSDVDLRLRPLQQVNSSAVFEPVHLDKELVDRILRDIAYKTTRCCPATGTFVPSARVPVAKLVFLDSEQKKDRTEGLKYDISLSSTNPFGTINSRFLRFLCHLEPRFHLLATVLRYWSTVHNLIVPGYLSSYALVSMLIFFCQTTEPPLLPTIDQMRDLELGKESRSDKQNPLKGITQAEWSCIVCFDKGRYKPSTNAEPLGVLLLKFFEFYLNFPYATHLITTRPGKALTFAEYESSSQFHPGFKLKPFLNIQDPFDLSHNLTSGMTGSHFHLVMLTMKYSYERLFSELLNNFTRPKSRPYANENKSTASHKCDENWGLLKIFKKLTGNEKKI